MPEENVEFVRRVYALLDQGDEAVWDLAPPGFLIDFSRRHINPVVLRGPDQARAWYEHEVAEVWEGGHTGWQPEELIDAGDMVVAFIRTSGRGKASGIEVEAYVWNVWTMSRENADTQGLENLRRGVDAWNRQDLDDFLETWHPDCEWRPPFPRSLEGVGRSIAVGMASPELGAASVRRPRLPFVESKQCRLDPSAPSALRLASSAACCLGWAASFGGLSGAPEPFSRKV